MSDSEAEAPPQQPKSVASRTPAAMASQSGSSSGSNGALIGGLLAAGVAIAGAVGYRLLAKREEGSSGAPSTSSERKKVASPIKKAVPRRATPEASGAAAAPATAAAPTPAQPRQARMASPLPLFRPCRVRAGDQQRSAGPWRRACRRCALGWAPCMH